MLSLTRDEFGHDERYQRAVLGVAGQEKLVSTSMGKRNAWRVLNYQSSDD